MQLEGTQQFRAISMKDNYLLTGLWCVPGWVCMCVCARAHTCKFWLTMSLQATWGHIPYSISGQVGEGPIHEGPEPLNIVLWTSLPQALKMWKMQEKTKIWNVGSIWKRKTRAVPWASAWLGDVSELVCEEVDNQWTNWSKGIITVGMANPWPGSGAKAFHGSSHRRHSLWTPFPDEHAEAEGRFSQSPKAIQLVRGRAGI